MRNSVLSVVLGVALLATTQPAGLVFGESPDPDQTVAVGVATVRQSGAVIGTAWRHDNSPVSGALLRLRNITTGRVVRGTESDAMGRFSFPLVPVGNYIVELVDERANIRAVGQMFSLAPGDTVATFIRLTNRAGFFDGFFGNAAAAALATAASLGVTAVGNGGQPASARF